MATANSSSYPSAGDVQHTVSTLQQKTFGFLGYYVSANPWTIVFTLLAAAVVYDQVKYILNKGTIAGPTMKMPFIGPFLESMNPQFERYLEKWASGPLSCVSVFHKFVVIASDRDMARKIFNAPHYVKPCVVDNAVKLLRPTSWVFLDGKAHIEYRKGLNGLFSRQALELYMPGLEEVYNRYFDKFIEASHDKTGKAKPIPFMSFFRELQCATSCRTFVGHYMPDETMKNISDNYYKITEAMELVNFPYILPFTKPWYGMQAANLVINEFSKCAAKSKVKIAAGGKPNCILDAWVLQMKQSKEYKDKVAQGIAVDESEKPDMLLREFSDYEIALTLLTFLFASQDATSSACTWLFQIMADRPDVLDKVREENLRVRGGDKHMPFTLEMLESMTYTKAVVKELLRYRSPVIMVPYVAKKSWKITEDYTIPKGSMVIPSVWPATHDPEAYPNPDYFDPDRWITGDAEKQTKNWLVFGTGPHYCLGQQYAQLNLVACIGKASIKMDWEHFTTPVSEEIQVFACLFPKDHCKLVFNERA